MSLYKLRVIKMKPGAHTGPQGEWQIHRENNKKLRGYIVLPVKLLTEKPNDFYVILLFFLLYFP